MGAFQVNWEITAAAAVLDAGVDVGVTLDFNVLKPLANATRFCRELKHVHNLPQEHPLMIFGLFWGHSGVVMQEV